MSWLDLHEELETMFGELVTFDAADRALSVRKSRTAIEAARRAYKAAWARAKYRRDATHRALQNAQRLARYHDRKAST